MWLFCEAGFFSVVHKDCQDDELMVRARAAEDLDALRRRCPGLGPTMHTPHGDYHYRALVKRAHLAETMAALVDGIDYGNFKAHVHGAGAARMSAYCRVWSAMADWQARRER